MIWLMCDGFSNAACIMGVWVVNVRLAMPLCPFS